MGSINTPAAKPDVPLSQLEHDVLDSYLQKRLMATREAEEAKVAIDTICAVILGRAGMNPAKEKYKINADITALVRVEEGAQKPHDERPEQAERQRGLYGQKV